MYIFYYIIRIQSRIQLQICAHRVCTYYVLIYEFASGTKSQMSMLPSYEPLTIWKSSNCRLFTRFECPCDKSRRNHCHGWVTQIKSLHLKYVMVARNALILHWSIPILWFIIIYPLMTKSLLCHTLKYQRGHLYSQTPPTASPRLQFRRTHYQAFPIMVPFGGALLRQVRTPYIPTNTSPLLIEWDVVHWILRTIIMPSG